MLSTSENVSFSDTVQLLGDHLKEADPEIYQILQNVRLVCTTIGAANSGPGKIEAEAFHQPDPLGEFHVSSSA